MLRHLVIRGKRVRLRPLVEADLAMTLTWRNKESIRRWFFSSGTVTPEQHYDWFCGYLTRDNDFVFIIEEIRTHRRAIGQLSLYKIDWEFKRAEFGRLMIGVPAAQRQGFAKEATVLLLDFAESEWGLQEIRLDVFADNLPAIAIYQRCGFITESLSKGVVHMVRKSRAGNVKATH